MAIKSWLCRIVPAGHDRIPKIDGDFQRLATAMCQQWTQSQQVIGTRRQNGQWIQVDADDMGTNVLQQHRRLHGAGGWMTANGLDCGCKKGPRAAVRV